MDLISNCDNAVTNFILLGNYIVILKRDPYGHPTYRIGTCVPIPVSESRGRDERHIPGMYETSIDGMRHGIEITGMPYPYLDMVLSSTVWYNRVTSWEEEKSSLKDREKYLIHTWIWTLSAICGIIELRAGREEKVYSGLSLTSSLLEIHHECN